MTLFFTKIDDAPAELILPPLQANRQQTVEKRNRIRPATLRTLSDGSQRAMIPWSPLSA